MLTLKVINLWAGPGAGKSTTAAGLFNLMKNLGLRVELVTEFAKDVTYEKNFGTLQNQLHVFAEQDRRLRRLEGQVEWAITDSPLPLSIAYMTPEYERWLEDCIWSAYDRYDNRDFFVQRVKPYMAFGRSQTESAALALDLDIRNLFNEATEDDNFGHSLNGDHAAPHIIAATLGLLRAAPQG